MRVGCQVAIVYAVTNGYLNDTPVKEVKQYEAALYELLENKYADLLSAIEGGAWGEPEIAALCAALSEMKR